MLVLILVKEWYFVGACVRGGLGKREEKDLTFVNWCGGEMGEAGSGGEKRCGGRKTV